MQTALIIDGERVGVLASREAAESCVEEIIAYYEAMIEEDSFESMETSIVNEISFEDAPDAKGIVTADALALAICHAHTGSSRIQEFYNQKKKKLI